VYFFGKVGAKIMLRTFRLLLDTMAWQANYYRCVCWTQAARRQLKKNSRDVFLDPAA